MMMITGFAFGNRQGLGTPWRHFLFSFSLSPLMLLYNFGALNGKNREGEQRIEGVEMTGGDVSGKPRKGLGD
jgi:hypothetical protein